MTSVWKRLSLILGLAIPVLLSIRLSGGSEHLEKELVIVATGGVFEQLAKEHFYDPFTKTAGVKIHTVAANTAEQFAKVKTMAQSGNVEWDIVSGSAATIPPHREFLARLDCQAIPNAAMQGVAGACQEYALLRSIGGGVIAYNTKTFPTGQHPRSWADFWDVKKFPGPRALPNVGSPWWVFAAALMADGVSPDRLIPMDLDRAFRKLDQLKPHVRVWWKTGDQSQQIMRDGEVVMAMMWSGRALIEKTRGLPIDIEWNQAIQDVAYWAIVKNAPHSKAAYAFLNFFMDRPQAHLAFSRGLNADTSNRLALELLSPAERRTRPTYESNWKGTVPIDDKPWVAENRAMMLERWNLWLAN